MIQVLPLLAAISFLIGCRHRAVEMNGPGSGEISTTAEAVTVPSTTPDFPGAGIQWRYAVHTEGGLTLPSEVALLYGTPHSWWLYGSLLEPVTVLRDEHGLSFPPPFPVGALAGAPDLVATSDGPPERIEVPAGTFESARSEMRTGTWSGTYWWRDGVGFVRAEFRSDDGRGCRLDLIDVRQRTQ